MSTKTRGGVRELSYDSKYAQPYGQTEAQIRADAKRNRKHVSKPDRWYLLRFLGLNQAN